MPAFMQASGKRKYMSLDRDFHMSFIMLYSTRFLLKNSSILR